MNESLKNLTVQHFPVSTLDLFFALALALILGMVVRIIYQQIVNKEIQDPLFDTALLFVPAILTVIMMLIGSNLALSIGLVGSLSIIRFRNVIKSSRDMVFLFWLIAIGLGCGTFSYKITLMSNLFIAIALLVAKPWIGRTKHSEHQLILKGQGRFLGSKLEEEFKKLKNIELEHLLESGEHWEVMYRFSSAEEAQDTLRKIPSQEISHASIHNSI